MEEATEICKLRLFLKLVAQAEANERLEPLPDIDFNIRAGNSLVGYATEAELDQALNRLGHAERKTEIKRKPRRHDLRSNTSESGRWLETLVPRKNKQNGNPT